MPFCLLLLGKVDEALSTLGGGQGVVVFLGMAKRVKTPLIGGQVKRGELEAVHIMRGKQKGLRIKAVAGQPELFDRTA